MPWTGLQTAQQTRLQRGRRAALSQSIYEHCSDMDSDRSGKAVHFVHLPGVDNVLHLPTMLPLMTLVFPDTNCARRHQPFCLNPCFMFAFASFSKTRPKLLLSSDRSLVTNQCSRIHAQCFNPSPIECSMLIYNPSSSHRRNERKMVVTRVSLSKHKFLHANTSSSKFVVCRSQIEMPLTSPHLHQPQSSVTVLQMTQVTILRRAPSQTTSRIPQMYTRRLR